MATATTTKNTTKKAPAKKASKSVAKSGGSGKGKAPAVTTNSRLAQLEADGTAMTDLLQTQGTNIQTLGGNVQQLTAVVDGLGQGLATHVAHTNQVFQHVAMGVNSAHFAANDITQRVEAATLEGEVSNDNSAIVPAAIAGAVLGGFGFLWAVNDAPEWTKISTHWQVLLTIMCAIGGALILMAIASKMKFTGALHLPGASVNPYMNNGVVISGFDVHGNPAAPQLPNGGAPVFGLAPPPQQGGPQGGSPAPQGGGQQPPALPPTAPMPTVPTAPQPAPQAPAAPAQPVQQQAPQGGQQGQAPAPTKPWQVRKKFQNRRAASAQRRNATPQQQAPAQQPQQPAAPAQPVQQVPQQLVYVQSPQGGAWMPVQQQPAAPAQPAQQVPQQQGVPTQWQGVPPQGGQPAAPQQAPAPASPTAPPVPVTGQPQWAAPSAPAPVAPPQYQAPATPPAPQNP